MTLTLKIQKLTEDAIVPQYAHPDDSGMDLCSINSYLLPVGGRKLFKIGISIQLPPGTEAQIRPRSGLALKNGIGFPTTKYVSWDDCPETFKGQILLTNTIATIDEGYRGELGVILENRGEKPFMVEKGMKIAQMVIYPVLRPEIEIVSTLTETERGAGGFGSTGV
jgi:dUTP pyrophosphatase